MRAKLAPRRGFTLIELMIVVTCTIALMTLSVNLIRAIANWSSDTEDTAHHAAAAHRMEELLRRDLHDATSVTVAGKTLSITMPEASSEWKLDGDACLLTRPAGEETHRERFETGKCDEWQESSANGLATVSLRTSAEPPREVLRVVERAPKLEGPVVEGQEP